MLLVAALGVALHGRSDSISDLSQIELPDQYGVLDRVADHRDPVVVIAVVTAKRLRNLKAWERALRDRYDDLDIVRIADVPPGSPATIDQVSAKLRQRVPEGVRVLIDMDGRWAAELALDTSRPNLLVLDGDRRLAATVCGLHDSDLEAQFVGAIDDLLDDS
jgi:hypothetical protein